MGADGSENGAFEGTHAAENSGAAAGGLAPGGLAAGGLAAGGIEADPARAAKVGVTAATVEAAIGDLAARMAGPVEAEQPSLMLDEMDEQMALFSGPVRHVADIVQGARGRGRPKGSTNKNAFRDVALRMGYRHPGLNLLALANADPLKLAIELAALNVTFEGITIDRSREMSRAELSGLVEAAHGIIARANAELMPYFEGKAAQQLDVNISSHHVMLFEETSGKIETDDDVLDLTSFPNPE